MATWIVEAGCFDKEEELRTIRALAKMGLGHVFYNFKGPLGSKRQLLDIDAGACVVSRGSINMVRALSKRWIPGGYCPLEELRCQSYYPYWGEYLLNSDHVMMLASEVIRRIDELHKNFGGNGLFVRPDDAAMIFKGMVLTDRNCGILHYYKKELCVVSSVKQIEQEFRYFVVKGRIIAGGMFMEGGKVRFGDSTSQATAKAEEIIASIPHYSPSPAYSIDVCKSGGNHYLVEVNSMSCAAFYGMDPQVILREVNGLADEDWADINDGLIPPVVHSPGFSRGRE